MRHTADSNWSMCPLVVSEWRKSTGTNGTSTWAKSMRIPGAGIVSSSLAQTPRRSDITEVQEHEHGLRVFLRLGNDFLAFLCCKKVILVWCVPPFSTGRSWRGLFTEGSRRWRQTPESTEMNRLHTQPIWKTTESFTLAAQPDWPEQRGIQTYVQCSVSAPPRNFTTRCVNRLSDWLILHCQLDLNCSLWDNISLTWARYCRCVFIWLT